MLWNTLYNTPINCMFQHPDILATIYLTLFFVSKILLIVPFQLSLPTAPKLIFFYWGPDPNDHLMVSSPVSVKDFQRHCVWVFWRKSCEKNTDTQQVKKCMAKPLKHKQIAPMEIWPTFKKITAALEAFILWWLSQDKSKCLLNFCKGLITWSPENSF